MTTLSTLKPPSVSNVVAVSFGLFVSYAGFRFFKYMKYRDSLWQKVKNREVERKTNFESARRLVEEVGLTAARSHEILSMNPDQLRTALRQREVRCIEVLASYVGEALRVQGPLNCVTLFILEAFDRAVELDNLAKDPSYDFPHMFGMPLSVKECIQVKGYDQTLGYASNIGLPADNNSIVVQLLQEQGFIPFALTNVPQSLLSFGCRNNIYGTTNNPYSKARTSGGSSGGEGSLIGGRGSIVGLGGDVGGSIRIPAHFSGICGIKPSHLRITTNGCRGSIPGRPLVNAAEGPMASTVDLCAKVLQCLFGPRMASLDPYVAPVPFNNDLYNSNEPLRIGFYVDDGYFLSSVPVQRAVQEAANALTSRGHTLVPFMPPRIPEALGLYMSALFIDGGRYISDRLSNDLFNKFQLQLIMMPYMPKWLFAPLLNRFGPKAEPLTHTFRRDTHVQRQVYASIMQYRHEFVQAMHTAGVDVLLCPPNAGPACEHHLPELLAPTISYTAIFNLLDFAAGVVPFTSINDADITQNAEYPDDDHFMKLVKQGVAGGLGLPIGVQVVAPPYSEEVVLRVMRDIEDTRPEPWITTELL